VGSVKDHVFERGELFKNFLVHRVVTLSVAWTDTLLDQLP
jgi:hypothetical protein